MNKDVVELLNNVKTQIDDISNSSNIYDDVMDISDMDIHRMLINLRTCLDYFMNDLLKKYSIKSHNKGYFPLFNKNKSKFKRSIRVLNLDEHHELFVKLERIQYYHSPKDREWMRHLNEYVNQTKHDKLIRADRQNKEEVIIQDNYGNKKIIIGEKGSITRMGKTDESGIIIDGKEIILPRVTSTDTIPREPVYPNVKKIQSVDLKLNGKPIVELITEIYYGVRTLIEKFSE